jgi:hypothetical protein
MEQDGAKEVIQSITEDQGQAGTAEIAAKIPF